MKDDTNEPSYKSILKKSVFETNLEWMELLLEFSDTSDENSIESFVDSIDEFKLMIINWSQTISYYFEHLFIQGQQFQNNTRMFWPDGVDSLVVNKEHNSDVTLKEMQKEIYKVTKNKIGGITWRKKPIKIRMLRTDWIQN